MALSRQQVEQFRAEGFTIAPHFFGAREVAAMQGELERLRAAGLGRNVATDNDGVTTSSTQVNLQIIPLSPQSDLFRALPFSAKVREAVAQLIGEAFILQLDQIFLKPAGHGAGTSWHQDNHYFGIADPAQGVGMWVAMHDASVANGTMHVVPRSHERVLEHIRDKGSDHHSYCRIDESVDEVVPVEIAAGGALFFNYGVAHCTKGNRTDRDRAGLALHFLKEELRDVARAGSQARPVLSGPHYRAGLDVYDHSLEGGWERACGLTPAVEA